MSVFRGLIVVLVVLVASIPGRTAAAAGANRPWLNPALSPD